MNNIFSQSGKRIQLANLPVFTIFLLLISICGLLYADTMEVSSRRLIEHSKFYDGKEITYKGEAITAVMKRGDYGWVNLSDGDNAIGIWCKSSYLEKINYLGGYDSKGDTVEVTGIFNRACQEHGGDLDIHADTIIVKKSGYFIAENINNKKIRLIIAVFLVVIALVLIFRKRI